MVTVLGCPLGGSWCGLCSVLGAKIADFGIQNGIKNGARRKSAVIKQKQGKPIVFSIFPWFEGYPFSLKIGSKSGSLSDPRRTPPKVGFMLIYVQKGFPKGPTFALELLEKLFQNMLTF